MKTWKRRGRRVPDSMGAALMMLAASSGCSSADEGDGDGKGWTAAQASSGGAGAAGNMPGTGGAGDSGHAGSSGFTGGEAGASAGGGDGGSGNGASRVFLMGRGGKGASDACPADMSCDEDETPEHEVTVSRATLDTFEVTVERFRPFVAAYDEWRNSGQPEVGAGRFEFGDDADSGEDGGWRADYGTLLPSSSDGLQATLTCGEETWTGSASAESDALPVNCVSWYVALAFCIWDGGRLPTEAEWEYAAAGPDNFLYPWGNEAPTGDLVVASCSETPGAHCRPQPVGSKPDGNGHLGHADLAGNLFEWVYDAHSPSWYAGEGNECDKCANTQGGERVLRGGLYRSAAAHLRAAARHSINPAARSSSFGFRCARSE